MFKQARFRLTIIYTAIIMTISLFFSAGIYKLATFEIDRVESRIRVRQSLGMIPPPSIFLNQEIIEEAKKRIIQELLVINLFIFVSSAGLSYWLSGQTLRPIHQVLESQKRFISDASHELKTPITTIKTSLEVFLRSKTKPNLKIAQKLLSDTLKDIKYLDNLTRQLLLLTTNSRNSPQNLKPREVISALVQKLKPLSDRKQLIFDTKLSANSLFLNSQAFEQVLVILLDNAIKFSPENSTIKIIFSQNLFTISNPGFGINSKDLPHVFDRFYQADTSRSKTSITGHGLGLSIAQKLCKENGWTLSASSQPNHKTTFFLRL